MGKGDKKSRKGKITMGSYGVLRPKNKKKVVATVNASSPKADAKKIVAKKAVAKKTATKKSE